MRLLKQQQLVANENSDTTIFLDGVAGTGKTTAAIERIKSLIRAGVAPESILVLVPQTSLALPYVDALRRSRLKTGANIQTATVGQLAVTMIDLFWPLVAEASGVAQPHKRPLFLSLEMVQYYMARFVAPEIERQDYFNSVHIDRNRLYTQIVDNLNKAALVGFPHETISQRLKSAWQGDVEQSFIYDDAQASASLFRQACLQHNLLDFSLQIELFRDHLWRAEPFWRYLTERYRHLIVDNLEEGTPVTHEFLQQWLPHCDSAVLICDTEAGFRRFLGADPQTALQLKELCAVHVTLDNHRVMSGDIEAFQIEMARSMNQASKQKPPKNSDLQMAIAYTDNRYHPQMLDWAADHIAALVHDEGVPPRDIVVLAAFLPDALRFALQNRLDEREVPHRSHRPSRALRDEPAARTLLTMAKLAHPEWHLRPDRLDVAFALSLAIAELDPVRARLLTDMLYRDGQLLPFERIQDPKAQSRITFELAARYDRLRQWLDDYAQDEPLDMFFSRLFGELLSQPAYGFHKNFDATNAAANLIDSAREFRQTALRIEPELPAGLEYVRMVDSGAIANLYVRDWANEKLNAVLLSPAYTFLMKNQPVDYQFWLNVGSTGWGQRLHQPLTHPYVLSRQWEQGRIWTDADEYAINQEVLYHVAAGLIRRCRKRIYIGFSEYGEQGMEQRGPLLMAVQNMLRRMAKEAQNV